MPEMRDLQLEDRHHQDRRLGQRLCRRRARSPSRSTCSQDPEFYPFKAKKYKLTIWCHPQQPDVPDYVQDRIGWKGEALTDKHYLDTKTQPGFRMLRKRLS